jgi:hypothetical protein
MNEMLAPSSDVAPALMESAGVTSAPAPVLPETSRPPWYSRLASWIGSVVEWLFGAATLIVTLAVFSVIPILNLLSLGYLLEVSGRVARTKKIRAGFIGVRKAAVFGRIIFGTWLVLWPARFVAGMSSDAELISPGSGTAAGWRILCYGVAILSVWHVVWACLRGGKLRHFFWPAPVRFFRWLATGDKFGNLRGNVWNYLLNLRARHYLKLGTLGFIGGVAWLAVPVGLLVIGAFLPPAGAVPLALLGGGLLVFVAMYLPFLQTHYAVENRFGALFELRRVRQMFNRAPVAFWISLFITLLFSLPLYLLKIEFPPKEIAWLPSLLFVVFICPARILTGWAVGRAIRREQPRHFIFRWGGRLGVIPVVVFYALMVYLTQYLSWNGALSLIEQHAFLVPAPMLSL